MLTIRHAVLCILLLGHHALASEDPDSPSLQQEYRKLVVQVVRSLITYYIEDVSSDSLMQAGIRGLIRSLDPSSHFSVVEADTAAATSREERWERDMETFNRFAQTIDRQANYGTTPDTLLRFGLAGMFEILDPHTFFFEKRNLEDFNLDIKGKYGGLGISIRPVHPDSAIAVWTVLHPNTPAARAGLRSGDLIIAIDDSTTRGLTARDAADKMRGTPGDPVDLTVARAGRSDTLMRIVREEVHLASVSHYTMFSDSTGYVRLEQFQANCDLEVRDALDELLRQGMQRLIFDLRNNTGGLLPEAVRIADFFLPRNHLVVSYTGRAVKARDYVTEDEALIANMPVVVLVNEGSASAAEIVAGAIQDWDRGLIMGRRTFGKGSVQFVVPIKDRGELKLTVAAYFTPSGRSIDKRMRKDSTLVGDQNKLYYTKRRRRVVRGGGGITPDIRVEGIKASPLFRQLAGWHDLNSQFFHFSRFYNIWNPDVGTDFRADDDIFQEFRKFAEKRFFDYVSEAEAHLQDLGEIAHDDEYEKLTKPIERLKREIDKVEERHWQRAKEVVLQKLTFDVLEKSFGLEVARAYDTTVDHLVSQAHAILLDSPTYEEWLARAEIGTIETTDPVD